MSEGPEWFRPKTFGLGSGPPIAWQGWAVLAGYAVIVTLAVLLLGHDSLATISVILSATAVLLVVCARTTRGGWHWRWGRKD